ncbi:phosphatase PAP2 family protein [Thiococcus pfennigii]|uniref:phosphatase PAP2 family protein n=1 Tax=Thiococcus pfennigii TaxID=1057 RepID=UPI001908FAE9|nr:phosphatase PAP2 family protein [Thiococcus pfennigii]MBK1701181.1 phosphatase PAP2 family protein [Thiococcus pfennigii]MBK1732124.1 phosphatase PAP2 family protein [Thiococcus pfennigii]
MRLWLQQLNEIEAPLCRAWTTRSLERRWIYRPFAVVSRLGDGIFWYSLIAILPLVDGWDGLITGVHMLATSFVALVLYKSLKGTTRRERPCHYAAGIRPGVPPLDRYSFPSGHTLQAVAFTTIALFYYPSLAVILVPFTLMVAASRVVLGLHYPSDVLVASAIGLALGLTSIALFG